jgi:hypothetical protein
MPTVAGPLRSRMLITPKEYPPLIDFCCGKERLEEHEVNTTVHRICAGIAQWGWITVVLEKPSEPDASGHAKLIGVCCVASSASPGLGLAGQDSEGGYIGAFGTDLEFRKHLLEDGKTRPGNALMRGALEAIQAIFGGPPMVYVFAKVKRSNAASKRLHDEHGFEDTGNAGGEHVLLRPPALEPTFTRPQSWSK